MPPHFAGLLHDPLPLAKGSLASTLRLVIPLAPPAFLHLARMSSTPPTRPYSPNAVLSAIYGRVFERIQVEDGWADEIRRHAENASVLYVLPNLNWLDFLALDYLTKRHGLPRIRFVNDLGLWLLNPEGPTVRGRGLLNMLLPPLRKQPAAELKQALEVGGSAALFLKRPLSVLDVGSSASGGRGVQEGDELVRTIVQTQREGKRSLVLVPLVFLWSKSPNRLEAGPVDFVLGSRTWPTPTRALGQLLSNLEHISMRMGEPIDLKEFMRVHGSQPDTVLVRRITYMTLRRLERERRTMVGPVQKSPARVRAEILRSPRLRSVISDLSGATPEGLKHKTAEAEKMLAELQATPSPDVVKAMGILLGWGFSKIYRGIDFVPSDVERVKQAARDGALVILPSHKSHIDYLVVSYFFYQQNLAVPLIAAGDNLNFQPVGPIFRRAGAFFIRRSFRGDRLYPAVVDAYIRRLIRDGYPMELFLEGGRSRTGKLLEPKYGLLSMIVDGALGVPEQKVHFVPLSIGYERVIEADSFQRELTGGEKKKEEATDLLSAREVLQHRYGRINLQFGNLLTIEDVCRELGIAREDLTRPAKRRAFVTRLGNRVMDEVNRVTAVTPGALTALALLGGPADAQPESDIILFCERALTVLSRLGARVTSPTTLGPGKLRVASIREALQMFVEADLARARAVPGGTKIYSVVDERRIQLDTSKNIIIHFFVERGLIAVAMTRSPGGLPLPTDEQALSDRVRFLSKLFKHEFRFRADAPFEEIFSSALESLIQDGHLTREGQLMSVGPGELGWSGDQWLRFYTDTIRSFIEAYLISARSLELLLGGPLSEKEFIKEALVLGENLYETRTILRREAISKPALQNALHAFAELGYVRARSDKWELIHERATPEALRSFAAALTGFLSGEHTSP